MMLITRFKSTLGSILRCDFLRREDGVVAVEAMIVMPLIFWTFLSMFSIFDTFRNYSINQKAAFTIGDAISRETVPLDDDYLDGTRQLFEYLARSEGKSKIRVSSVWYNKRKDKYRVDWSKSRGSMAGLLTRDVKNWHDRLPVLPHRERLILVETWTEYDPPFDTGLEQREIRNFVFTRPRYAPKVCWEDCN